MEQQPGAGASTFEQVKNAARAVITAEPEFREAMHNGRQWLACTLQRAMPRQPNEPEVNLGVGAVRYLPAGRVTAEDVKAFRDAVRRAVMQDVQVLAAADGFEADAPRSMRRGKAVDYFAPDHLPANWEQPRLDEALHREHAKILAVFQQASAGHSDGR